MRFFPGHRGEGTVAGAKDGVVRQAENFAPDVGQGALVVLAHPADRAGEDGITDDGRLQNGAVYNIGGAAGAVAGGRRVRMKWRPVLKRSPGRKVFVPRTGSKAEDQASTSSSRLRTARE